MKNPAVGGRAVVERVRVVVKETVQDFYDVGVGSLSVFGQDYVRSSRELSVHYEEVDVSTYLFIK